MILRKIVVVYSFRVSLWRDIVILQNFIDFKLNLSQSRIE
jgi:hypothetical protein